MTDQKQARDPRDQQARQTDEPNADYTQYMQDEGATGVNRAYGNTPGNTGARFDAPEP